METDEERMTVAKSILHMIDGHMNRFSKGQKRIAGYILEHYNEAASMTASRLGKLVGVSESTVVRFASELGYDGYPSMQRALQEMIDLYAAHPGGGEYLFRPGYPGRGATVRY